AETVPEPKLRPEGLALSGGESVDLGDVAELLEDAGYERVEQVEERGQFAVRGGLVDVFPTTGREPLRIELFGDEIEAIRAFSPFTQRTLHPVEGALVYPAAERRADLAEPRLPDDDETPAAPADLVPIHPDGPDIVWQPDEVRAVWEEELGGQPPRLNGVSELDPLPSGQPFSFEAQRPAVAARGLAEAENELRAFVRAGNRVVVAFPHRGEALRTEGMLRRVEAQVAEPGAELPSEAELLFAVSPARRGFVWRDLGLVLLPDTQVFRKRLPRRTAPSVGRALQSFAELRTGDHVVHEDHGVGRLIGFETREVAEVTRDYLLLAFRGDDRLYVPHEQVGKVSRYVGVDGKAPTLSKLGGRAWHLLKSRARASIRE
ncbi:MAG: CarD family transcriptional regulator, partial [Gaiellaceae bacterium]